jgi:GrpB-like predicted nucleotidyltransferase (UPF0157 family)
VIVILNDRRAARRDEVGRLLAQRLGGAVVEADGMAREALLTAARSSPHLVVLGAFGGARAVHELRWALGTVDEEVHAYRLAARGDAGGTDDVSPEGDVGLQVDASGLREAEVAAALWGDLREEVVLVPHDPRWPELFEAERAALARELGGLATAIEHVGSTAVPGLAAKPVLDILITTARFAAPAPFVTPLRACGYAFVDYPGNVTRWFFRKGAPRTHHAHVVEHGGAEHHDHVDFRDALRADAAVRRRYEALKRELATAHPRDRAAYGAGKSALVAATLAAWRTGESTRS